MSEETLNNKCPKNDVKKIHKKQDRENPDFTLETPNKNFPDQKHFFGKPKGSHYLPFKHHYDFRNVTYQQLPLFKNYLLILELIKRHIDEVCF